MLASGWSEAQKRAYVLADNQLALNAGWNAELLNLEVSELDGLGFDLGLIGFDASQLAAMTAKPGLTDPDEVPPEPVDPISVLGDRWLLGRHRLICGDATNADDVAALLEGIKPHLMVTDPPYGVSYDPAWRMRAGVNLNERKLGKVDNDDRADWREAWALFPGDVAYVWHGAVHAVTVTESLVASQFEVRAQIVWAKDRLVLGRGDYHWQHEPCWYVVRTGATGHWNGDRTQVTVWNIPSRDDSGHGHGTQKPVECMRRPIENNSKPGEPVYDPFSGSGTTIIAAEMTGRSCYAIEINPAYVDVAIERWQQFTGHDVTHANSGQTFEQIRTCRRNAA
jgi:DNA modification methylase